MYFFCYIGDDIGAVFADLAASMSVKDGKESAAVFEVVVDDDFFWVVFRVQSSMFCREGKFLSSWYPISLTDTAFLFE